MQAKQTRRRFLGQTALAAASTSAAALFPGLVAAAGSAASTQLAQAGAASTSSAARGSMKTYKVPHTELKVSRMAYGTANVGGDKKEDFIEKAKQGIRTAYDNGITFFDLADVYGDGQSETALGQVLKESPGLREKIVILSKCGLVLGEAVGGLGVDLSREHIVRAVEGSLQRLGTDRLDILLLHNPDALVEPQEVAQAFDALHRSGKVRHFGVSNCGVAQIELLKKTVRQPLVANQIRVGLGYSAPIRDLKNLNAVGIVDYCRLHEIQVQAFSPLRVGSDITRAPGFLNPPPDATPELKKVAQALIDLAQQKDANPSAIALAWLLRHPAGIVPVIGAIDPKYIVENCVADRVELSREEWYRLLNYAAAIQPGRSA